MNVDKILILMRLVIIVAALVALISSWFMPDGVDKHLTRIEGFVLMILAHAMRIDRNTER